jgi:predicted secreted protein
MGKASAQRFFRGLCVSGENTVGPEVRSRWKTHWKRVVLFAVLFSILIVSLFYFVLPNILYPLRIDKIPAGAYVVPWMEPNPSVGNLTIYSINSEPWDIDTVMAGALTLDMTFTVSVLNQTRIVPSTVYLGHDSEYLYIGGQFHGMYLNPNDYDNAALENMFGMLFDVTDKGQLAFPEAGSLFGDCLWQNASLQFNEAAWTFDDVFWWNTGWHLQRDFYPNESEPAFAEKDTAAEYDNVTGTMTVLFSRYLWCRGNSLTNAFQMKPGERWVIGFMLMLGYSNGGNVFTGGCLATWPEGYSFESNDSSSWPKLVIDLTNQPATFPGQTTPRTES